MSQTSDQILWKAENEPVGKALGYPQCCIDEFCQLTPAMMRTQSPTEKDQIRMEASHVNGFYTGFIPCYEHARQIMYGKIKLEELIDNRSLSLPPFPQA